MHALGRDAQAIWDALSPEEAARLKSEMQETDPQTDSAVIEADYLSQMTSTKPPHDQQTSSLSDLKTDRLKEVLSFVTYESPQITALILSMLPEQTAAATLQALPKQSAVKALHRLMHMGPLHPSARQTVEAAFAERIQTTNIQKTGPDRLADILNNVDSATTPALIGGLDDIEPGSAEHVRALMFTFDDLATLDPASLQTLLANTDRALLIVALQDAKASTADAFYRNMTSRAGDVLRSEIEGNGPYRAADIAEARREIAATARKLVRRGDLLSASPPDQDLIE
ncbi:MAG: FliG C-terminal domain-containing protein [Pseudomonadota bacterium]